MKHLSSFARKVYQAVATIPLGETRSYQWVAAKAGNPKACRAVGQILKRNPYPILIPCHRVVASDNRIGGYAFGIERKRHLLQREQEITLWLKHGNKK
jgi:methylated-DNA-[protein]-cysteine S-methyltransferase